MIIRPTTPDDSDAIVALVRDAFTNRDHDGQEEVAVVLATWSTVPPADRFELVADRDGTVIGHVLAARGALEGRAVLGIAPLSVAPAFQRSGVGTALMHDILARIDRAGHPLVVLLGSPAYYGRFGFEPSGPLGITYRPVGADNPHFMVRRFGGHDLSLTGDYVYCWEEQPG